MIRFPAENIFVSNVTATANVEATFVLPSFDFDGMIAKCTANTFVASTFDAYIQTSDDGGTTFYDCAHFNVNGTVTTANALFQQLPIVSGDGRYIGNVASGTSGSITAGTVGVPLLSRVGRVRWVFTGVGSTSMIAASVALYANQQSGGY